MTPPKCRLCGKEHWPRAGCNWSGAGTRETKAAKRETKVPKRETKPAGPRRTKKKAKRK